jgi:hypothetical protein
MVIHKFYNYFYDCNHYVNWYYVLEVDAYQKPDPEITKELFYVDTQNYIVLCNEMYKGNDLVFQYKLEYINTNVNLNASLFKL